MTDITIDLTNCDRERLQLAVNGAIQTVQLHAQLLQRIERERVVAQITQKIHQTLDLGEILQMTVTEVRHFLSNDRVVIFRLHSDGWGTVATESVDTGWNSLQTELYQQAQKELIDRRRVEAELRESEERLQQVLAGARAGSWDWEILTGKVTWSPENYDLHGLDPAKGSPEYEDWLNTLHQDDRERVNAQVSNLLEQGFAEFRSEFRIVHPQRGIRWLVGLGRLTFNESGKPHRFRGINLDITDRKQAEIERDRLLQQEQAARALAEQANRAKDEFLAMLSHELRTPLNPILGWVKLLQTGKFEGAKMAQALATIERNVRLQTQLIDDLLDVAKIQPGKLNMDCVSVNLVAIVESAIDTVNTAAVAKSIWIVPVLSSIGLVFGDATRLQQVVWNLLSNCGIYYSRQLYFKSGRIPNRAELHKVLGTENQNLHYKAFYSDTAQQILTGVAESFKSFLGLLKGIKNGTVTQHPKLPGYRQSGMALVTLSPNASCR